MQTSKKKALFLYLEPAGYVEACFKKTVQNYPVELHIVKYPLDPNAPFRFDDVEGITYYDRKQYDGQKLNELADAIKPDFIFCNGWMDKGYVQVAKQYSGKIPTVLAFDNLWEGKLKQYIASVTAPFILPRIFSHCWVPGQPQVVYAKKLGFKENRIETGMYSANYELFDRAYQKIMPIKEKKFPKRFIFVGRYIEIKGIRELWQAFIQLQNEMPNEWELWCLGKGPLEKEFPQHPKIRNVGFVQPSAMEEYLLQTGVFLLPTYDEHWGVVVHEYAIAGYPLLLSTKAPAGSAFLKQGENGYYHEPSNVESLKKALKKIMLLSDNTLIEMGKKSHELSKSITPDIWASVVWKILNSN
ncbi:MAG TPA: glycosyltransferase family 4 protein [Bacteroidia bacterium]|jgi:glycosyltransferase involved in cell wall biosynthesis|nr:glycosyltransferase family 4 protein [Bacteroidia bacterium]HMU19813.1 glycosyltransferase family 4 protein [Bacteroidia bacterium]